MDIGPRTDRDREIFPHLEPIEGRISGEQILCGRGLVNAYRAVAKADGRTPRFTTPAEITAAALDSTDPVAEEALALFVTCLARTAGDLALVFKSQGGVFLTGGIAQKIVPALREQRFRAAFEDKAPHSDMMRGDAGLCHYPSARGAGGPRCLCPRAAICSASKRAAGAGACERTHAICRNELCSRRDHRQGGAIPL